MAYDTRELFARLIQCEAGGEGEDGIYPRYYRLYFVRIIRIYFLTIRIIRDIIYT